MSEHLTDVDQLPAKERPFDYRVEGTRIQWDFPGGIGERAATLPELYLWAQIERLQEELAREVGTRAARAAEIDHLRQENARLRVANRMNGELVYEAMAMVALSETTGDG